MNSCLMLSITPRKESIVTREKAAANQLAKLRIAFTVGGLYFLLVYCLRDMVSKIRVIATKKVATEISSTVE